MAKGKSDTAPNAVSGSVAKDKTNTAPNQISEGVEKITQHIKDANASALIALNQAVAWASTFSVAAGRIETASAKIAESEAKAESEGKLAITRIVSQRNDALTAINHARDFAIAAVQSAHPSSNGNNLDRPLVPSNNVPRSGTSLMGNWNRNKMILYSSVTNFLVLQK